MGVISLLGYRWVIGTPPAKGNLRKELTILARQLYTHPVTNKLTCFHFSTIEAWYYRAKNSGDPIMALGRKVRSDDGFKISKGVLRRIIKNAGYKYKKARKVLTSNDPNYKEKLDKIKRILSNLGPNEKFFSIDEYGPFAIKMQGGKSLIPAGTIKTIPQWQKSKGSLIITAALELSTNQIVHFYSKNKNTDEMIKLLDILIDNYSNQECIYLSWDAASWHASKKLYERVDELNSNEFKIARQSPMIKLAPLPTCAQFLNVIESVFSGMARAIIHNSDYKSVKECQCAIDKYFAERNENFRQHPKQAGNKIWGKEIVTPAFDESKNCKDPMY